MALGNNGLHFASLRANVFLECDVHEVYFSEVFICVLSTRLCREILAKEEISHVQPVESGWMTSCCMPRLWRSISYP